MPSGKMVEVGVGKLQGIQLAYVLHLLFLLLCVSCRIFHLSASQLAYVFLSPHNGMWSEFTSLVSGGDIAPSQPQFQSPGMETMTCFGLEAHPWSVQRVGRGYGVAAGNQPTLWGYVYHFEFSVPSLQMVSTAFLQVYSKSNSITQLWSCPSSENYMEARGQGLVE